MYDLISMTFSKRHGCQGLKIVRGLMAKAQHEGSCQVELSCVMSAMVYMFWLKP